ncbi:hypothetical protein ACLOJK_025953 [Asimina triloba]
MELHPVPNFRAAKQNHSSKETLMSFGISMGCLYVCRDRSGAHRFGTRVWNLTERPIDLQIRVGSLLKRAHTLKPGSSKRLKCKSIYKAYMPTAGGICVGLKRTLIGGILEYMCVSPENEVFV